MRNSGKGEPETQGICDASGFKFPLRELQRQWDGARVHPRFIDRCQQPQDFVRGVKERGAVPNARPESPNQFIDPFTPVTPEDL